MFLHTREIENQGRKLSAYLGMLRHKWTALPFKCLIDATS